MTSPPARPLVTIGIPTYNRATLLPRALESALAQDYPSLDIVISDNASTDATEAVCRDLAARDRRIRVLRHPKNLGATANFRAALAAARGDFFMWLADDDWLDPQYISRCAAELLADPTCSLVCGSDVYHTAGEPDRRGPVLNLEQASPGARVVSYYRQVGMNGAYYGLMRRDQLERIPIDDALAGDWRVVAAMAYLGKLRTLDSVFVHRSTDGVSRTWDSVTTAYGLTGFGKQNPILVIARAVFADLAWRSPIYASLSPRKRLLLATDTTQALIRKHYAPRHLPGLARQLVRAAWGARPS